MELQNLKEKLAKKVPTPLGKVEYFLTHTVDRLVKLLEENNTATVEIDESDNLSYNSALGCGKILKEIYENKGWKVNVTEYSINNQNHWVKVEISAPR